MKTDREILDMLAIIPEVKELIDMEWEAYRRVWNPIDDGGQALKLAVHLGMDIIQNKIQRETTAKFFVGSKLEFVVSIRWDMMDKMSATRRAIVLVAERIAIQLSKKSVDNT